MDGGKGSGSGGVACPQCGAVCSGEAKFCGHCGARLAAASGPPGSQAETTQATDAAGDDQSSAMASRIGKARQDGQSPSPPAHRGRLVWERDVPLLLNRFMLRDWLLVVLSIEFVFVVVSAMIVIFNDLDFLAFLALLQFTALIAGAIIVLIVFVCAVFFWNGFHMRFTVDEDGATIESGLRERRINRITAIIGFLGLLSGRPGPLGAALLAQSRETIKIQWRDVFRVVVYPGPRVIALSNSWRTAMRLYCSQQNFSTVAEQVRAYAAAGERWRAEHPRRKRPLNLFAVKWLVVTAIATIAATAWGDDTAGLAIGAGALVLLAGLIEWAPRRILGVLGVGATVFLAVEVGRQALARTEIPPVIIYGYQYDTPLLYVASAGILALLLLGLLRVLARRGNSVQQPSTQASFE